MDTTNACDECGCRRVDAFCGNCGEPNLRGVLKAGYLPPLGECHFRGVKINTTKRPMRIEPIASKR